MGKKKLALLITLVAGIILLSFGMSGCEKTDSAKVPESVNEQVPELRTEPMDVRAEVGLYSGLADDLASLDVVNDVTKRVDVFPQSITFGDTTLELSADATDVYLQWPGTYTVQFGMRDEDGNLTTGFYRIIAEDAGNAPCLDLPTIMAAWRRDDGTVVIPSANVIHNAPTTVTAAVFDGEEEVPVTDGAFAAEEKAYTIIYTATDEQGRSAQGQMVLLVNPEGVINEFNTAGEEALWGYETRIEDGELFIESESGIAQIEYAENFLCGDWSGRSALHLVMRNNKAGEAVVRVQVMSDGAWKDLPAFKLDGSPVNEAMTRTDGELTDQTVALNGIDKVDGIRLTVECAGGVGASVDRIYVDTESTETADGSAVDYYFLQTQESFRKEITADVPKAEENAVHYQLTASARGNVQIGLEYENTTIYTRTTLEKGLNDLVRVPALEDENAVGSLRSIILRNMEDYPISIRLDHVEYTSVNGIKDYCLAEDTTFALAYGDTFYTPNPIALDGRYYSDLSVALCQQGRKIRDLSIGEALYNEKKASKPLQSGTEYSLQYSFKDRVSGKTVKLSYPLIAMKHTLSFTLEAPAMFQGDSAEIKAVPDSEIFTQEQLQKADISGYYREKGKKTWTPFETFNAEKSKTYEFKYVVSLEGFRTEKRFERYIHKDADTLDFEYEPAAVTGKAIYYSDVQDSFVEERFLHDGGYYDFKLNGYNDDADISTDWSVSGKQSYRIHHDVTGWGGFRIAPNMAKEPVNAVRFWANASVGQTTQISLLTTQGWIYTETFDMQPGEHQYTVYLEREDVTDVSIFTVQMIGGITVYFDDVEIIYLDPLSLSQPKYPTVLDISEGIELEMPKLHSDIFTEEQLAEAAWKCTYSLDKGEQIELLPDDRGVYILNLTEGGYVSVTWTAQVESEVASCKTKFAAGIVPFDVKVQTGRLNKKVTVIAPKYDKLIDESKCSGKVEWRLENGKWTETAVGEQITLKEVGVYELRYTAEYPLTADKTIYGERIYKIIVPEKDMLWHFEDSDPWYGAQPYDWNIPVVTSIVEEKEDGTHWLAIYSSENFDSWRGITAKNDSGLRTWTRTNKLIFTVTATRDIPEMTFWFKTDKSEEYKTVELKKGENLIDLTLSRPFERIHTFSVLMPRGCDPIYIDDIRTGPTSVPRPASPPRGENVFEDFEYDLPEGASFYAPDTLPRIEELDNGNHVLAGQYSVNGIGWLGIKDASYNLGQSVNKIRVTLTQHTSSPVKLKATDFWIDTDAGDLYAMNLKKDGDVYTLTFAKPFTQVKAFAVAISKEMNIVYVDNLQIVPQGEEEERPPMAEGMIDDFEGGLPKGSDFYAPNTLPRFESVDENTMLVGQYSVDGIAWLGIKDAYYQLGKSVQKIQINLTQSAETPVAMKPADFWIDTDVGGLYPADLEVDGNVYTLTFAQPFTELRTFAIAINKDMGIVYLDDLRICKDAFPVVVPVPHSGLVGVKYTVDLPTVPANATDVSYTIKYRMEGAAAWNTIEPVDGSYAFTPDVEGTYELSYHVVGTVDGKQYTFDKIVNFRIKAKSLDPKLVVDFADGDISNVSSATASFELIEKDGAKWVTVYSGAGDWVYLENLGYSAGEPIDALLIEMETKAPIKPESVYVYTDEGAFYPKEMTLEGGIYRFTFDKTFMTLDKIGIEVSPDTSLLIKQIRANTNPFAVQVPALISGTKGVKYSIALPTVPEKATDVSYTVKYRVEGTETWTTVNPVDGSYMFTPDTQGIYEVSYQVTGTVDGKQYTFEKTVQLLIKEPIKDPELVIDFADGDVSRVTSPTASFEVIDKDGAKWLSVYSGMGDWVYLKNLNYTNGSKIDAILAEMESGAKVTADSIYIYTDAGNFYASSVSMEDNMYKFTFSEPFTKLNEITMLVNPGTPLQIKQVRVRVNPFEVTDPTLPDGKVDEAYNVVLPSVPETATDVTYTVQYRVKGTEAWTNITPADGNYVFTPDTKGTYEISYQVAGTVDGKRYTYEKVVELVVIDETAPVDPYLIEDFADGDVSNVTIATAEKVVVEKEDGKWLSVYCGASDWLYLNDLNYSCGKTIEAIDVELTSTAAIAAGSAYLYTDQGEFYATGVTNEGNIYRFTFDKEITQLNRLALVVAADSTLQIKQVRAYVNPFQVTEPSLTSGKVGEAYTVALPAVPETATNVSYTVQYRVKDAEQWQTIEPVDGSYVFTPDTKGTYEISYQVTGTMDGKEYTYNKVVEVEVAEAEQPAEKTLISVIDFSGGDMSNFSSSTATAEIVEIDGGKWLSVFSGAGDWLYLNNLNCAPGKTIESVVVELKCDSSVSAGHLYIYTDSGEFYASSVTQEGDVYRFTFTTEFTQLNKISMLVPAGIPLQIKQVSVIA